MSLDVVDGKLLLLLGPTCTADNKQQMDVTTGALPLATTESQPITNVLDITETTENVVIALATNAIVTTESQPITKTIVTTETIEDTLVPESSPVVTIEARSLPLATDVIPEAMIIIDYDGYIPVTTTVTTPSTPPDVTVGAVTTTAGVDVTNISAVTHMPSTPSDIVVGAVTTTAAVDVTNISVVTHASSTPPDIAVGAVTTSARVDVTNISAVTKSILVIDSSPRLQLVKKDAEVSIYYFIAVIVFGAFCLVVVTICFVKQRTVDPVPDVELRDMNSVVNRKPVTLVENERASVVIDPSTGVAKFTIEPMGGDEILSGSMENDAPNLDIGVKNVVSVSVGTEYDNVTTDHELDRLNSCLRTLQLDNEMRLTRLRSFEQALELIHQL